MGAPLSFEVLCGLGLVWRPRSGRVVGWLARGDCVGRVLWWLVEGGCCYVVEWHVEGCCAEACGGGRAVWWGVVGFVESCCVEACVVGLTRAVWWLAVWSARRGGLAVLCGGLLRFPGCVCQGLLCGGL